MPTTQERFNSPAARDARYAELKAQGVKNLFRFTTSEPGGEKDARNRVLGRVVWVLARSAT